MGHLAGDIVAKILKGQRPSQIPIENACRYALSFNLRRAEQLRIRIPDDVLMAADDVVR